MTPTRTLDTDPRFSTEEVLLSEHEFDRKEKVEALIAFLRREKATGQLTFHFNRGGITRVSFAQKQLVDVQVNGSR